MANEKRLIDANATADAIAEVMDKYDGYDSCQNKVIQGLMKAQDVVADAPTVDAVEVVHGWWVPLEYDGYADGNPVWDLWECSKCREEHSGDEDTLTPYCPHCGAKMDGENENE